MVLTLQLAKWQVECLGILDEYTLRVIAAKARILTATSTHYLLTRSEPRS